MKKMLLTAAVALLGTMAMAQTNLPAPNKAKKTASVMEALSTRHSSRAFSAKELSMQELSDLLWAACGKNRPDGKLTAPTGLTANQLPLINNPVGYPAK